MSRKKKGTFKNIQSLLLEKTVLSLRTPLGGDSRYYVLLEKRQLHLSIKEMAQNQAVQGDTLCRKDPSDPWKKIKDTGVLLKKIERLRRDRNLPQSLSDKPSENSWETPIGSKQTNDLCLEAPLMMKGGKEPKEFYLLLALLLLALIWLITKGSV